MRWYIARRVAWAGVVAFVILTITFVLLDLAPDAQLAQVQFQAAQGGGDAESAAEAYRQRRGLDGPLWQRYADYLTNLATGDWGWSDTRSQPVTEAILTAIPYSMMYSIPSIILSTVIGMGIGLYSALNQYTKTDYAATFVAFFGISIPNFWLGPMLLILFSLTLQALPHPGSGVTGESSGSAGLGCSPSIQPSMSPSRPAPSPFSKAWRSVSPSSSACGGRSVMPTVRSPWTLLCPRTGSTPAPGRPTLPCSSRTLTTSRIVATACLCWVRPIAQQAITRSLAM